MFNITMICRSHDEYELYENPYWAPELISAEQIAKELVNAEYESVKSIFFSRQNNGC